MSKQYHTITDFNLIRKPCTDRFETAVYNFLVPFIGEPVQESEWKVYNVRRSADHRFLLKYAVSFEKRSFIVINAVLEDEDSGIRITGMRLKHIILDSWMAEGGPPNALHYLGIWRITNESITEHMIETYIGRHGSLDQGDQIVLKPKEDTGFHDNAFLRCGLSLAKELQRIKYGTFGMEKAYYVKSGRDEDDLMFYIVMQFGEEGGEEEKEADGEIPELEVKPASDSDDADDEVIFRGRAVLRKSSRKDSNSK